MKKIIVLLLALLATQLLRAQTLYAVTGTNNIYSINQDYSVNYIATAIFPNNAFADIAISPSGSMYGIAGNEIYEINITTGIVTHLVQLPPDTYNALVCSSNYELYSINLSELALYKYNLLTHEVTNIAYLGFVTSGDITFYKGNLIFSSKNPADGAGVIKAYNLETGTVKDIFCDPVFANFYGLTSLHNDCDNEFIFGSNTRSQLFNVDIETQTLVPIPIQFPGDNQFAGMASTTEHLGSLCETRELENISCFLSIDYNLKQEITVYPNPATDVLHFKNHDQIKSITIYDATGKEVKTVSNITGASLDISDLTTGVYLIKLNTKTGYSVRKIVKK